MALKKVKTPIPVKGTIITSKNSYSIDLENLKHPIFCFKYLHKDFHLDACTSVEKIALINQLVRLSSMNWIDIQGAPKYGMGSEKIATSSIRPSLPRIITEDVKSLLALRFLGKAPFIGLRNKFIFHVIYIDRAFLAYTH